MQTFILILAWTSLIVSSFYWAIIALIAFISIIARAPLKIKIGSRFFAFVTMFVWPIVYFIVT